MDDAPNPYDAPKAPLDHPAGPKRPNRWLFSFIELVIILGIIGVLIALLLPAVRSARHSAIRHDRQSGRVL